MDRHTGALGRSRKPRLLGHERPAKAVMTRSRSILVPAHTARFAQGSDGFHQWRVESVPAAVRQILKPAREGLSASGFCSSAWRSTAKRLTDVPICDDGHPACATVSDFVNRCSLGRHLCEAAAAATAPPRINAGPLRASWMHPDVSAFPTCDKAKSVTGRTVSVSGDPANHG